MKNKGLRNIEIADYLNKQFITGAKSKECFKEYAHQELYPLIVNRWYYGLYLIAKDMLDLDYAHHKGRHWDKNKQPVDGIWYRLAKEIGGEVLKDGERLYKLRNYFDYNASKGVDVDHKEFRKAKKLYDKICLILVEPASEYSNTQGK